MTTQSHDLTAIDQEDNDAAARALENHRISLALALDKPTDTSFEDMLSAVRNIRVGYMWAKTTLDGYRNGELPCPYGSINCTVLDGHWAHGGDCARTATDMPVEHAADAVLAGAGVEVPADVLADAIKHP